MSSEELPIYFKLKYRKITKLEEKQTSLSVTKRGEHTFLCLASQILPSFIYSISRPVPLKTLLIWSISVSFPMQPNCIWSLVNFKIRLRFFSEILDCSTLSDHFNFSLTLSFADLLRLYRLNSFVLVPRSIFLTVCGKWSKGHSNSKARKVTVSRTVWSTDLYYFCNCLILKVYIKTVCLNIFIFYHFIYSSISNYFFLISSWDFVELEFIIYLF